MQHRGFPAAFYPGHYRACKDDGLQITSCRGSPTYTVFFLSFVTCYCHPFPSPQIASDITVTAQQDTGHMQESGRSRALIQGDAVGGFLPQMSSVPLGPTRAESVRHLGETVTTRANHHHRQLRTTSGDTSEMTDLDNFILWFDISSDRLVIISLPLAASPWPFRPASET